MMVCNSLTSKIKNQTSEAAATECIICSRSAVEHEVSSGDSMRFGGGTLGVRGVCPFPFDAASRAIVGADPVSILLVFPYFNVHHTRSCLPRPRSAHHASVSLHECESAQSRAIYGHRDSYVHWERLSRTQKSRGRQETGD